MNSVFLLRIFHGRSSASDVIIPIALMLFSGFALTRVTKRLKLPNVTGYILAGILIGPFGLNLIGDKLINGTGFIADIALAFIAFSTGEFFTFSTLKKNGLKVCIITFLEAALASIFVFILSFSVLKMDFGFALVLSALASTTAPASTVMTIRQLGAKGDFVNTLLQVVALDDVFGLVAYSMAISLAVAGKSGSFQISAVVIPILVNIFVLILGGLFGALMKLLMPKNRSTDNRLIITIALLFCFCGICALLDVSPLLGCMSMGTVYINITGDDKIFKQLNYFSPPILLLFFVRSGVNFKIDALFHQRGTITGASLLVVGVSYFLVRILGKYAGSFLGSALVGKKKEVRNYLGLALIPQAGVAIGLSALGARILGGEDGSALETVILASSVLYELIGPACAKLALYLSKSYAISLEERAKEAENKKEMQSGELGNVRGIEQRLFGEKEVIFEGKDVEKHHKFVDGKNRENGKSRNEVELLIARIQAIQQDLRRDAENISEEEKAFTEAAEEQCGA